MDCSPASLLCPWGFSRQGYWSGLPCPLPGDLPNWGIEPRSPALWADSLPTEPPGKPKNTGVGSLSLLQRIFLTQESTRVSWVAGRFFTIWATGEAPVLWIRCYYPSFTNKEAERCNLPEVIKLCQSHDSKPQQSGSRIHALTVRHLLTRLQNQPHLPVNAAVTIINLYHYLLSNLQLSSLSCCVSFCRQNRTRSVLWNSEKVACLEDLRRKVIGNNAGVWVSDILVEDHTH